MTVAVPVCDLLKEPNQDSELISQTLYGESLSISDKHGEFVYVKCSDKYHGWAANKNLVINANSEVINKIVISNFAVFRITHNGFEITLPFGAQLSKTPNELYRVIGTDWEMQLQDGTLEELNFIPINEPAKLARQFLSVPYLWGGSSPIGFDCSGLVQAVYRRYGIILPRDSVDQMDVGITVNMSDAKSSDLIFFPGHVAFYCGKGEILHATKKHGKVVKEALADRADIKDEITTVQRVWGVK